MLEILSVYNIILSGPPPELWFVILKDLVEQRIVFSKCPSHYYTSNLLEKQTEQLILLCVPNRNSCGLRDSWKGTEFIESIWVFENSSGFWSCVGLRSQFLEFGVSIGGSCHDVHIAYVGWNACHCGWKDRLWLMEIGKLSEEPMLRMPKEGKETGLLWGLELAEGRRKIGFRENTFHMTANTLLSPFLPVGAYGKVHAAWGPRILSIPQPYERARHMLGQSSSRLLLWLLASKRLFSFYVPTTWY